MAVAIGTTDTTIPIELGRQPSGYIVVRNSAPAKIYDGVLLGSDWTPTSITLRASEATVASLLVF